MTYGYICFAYSKNEWIAKQIAWFTKSQWSHSFITMPPMVDRDMCLEAAGNGVSITPFDNSYRNNSDQKYEVYKFKIDPADKDKALSLALDTLESSYGYLEYPWFIWRAINLLFGRDIKHQDNWSRQGTICSTVVRNYIENCGYALFSEYGIDATNAQDVYQVVLSRSDLFELVEKKD